MSNVNKYFQLIVKLVNVNVSNIGEVNVKLSKILTGFRST